jgi:hypothetical protein
MVLLAVFVVSPLIVVGALWAVAAINTSWALIGALGVYVTTTLVVFATVAFVCPATFHCPEDTATTGDRSTCAPPRPARIAPTSGHAGSEMHARTHRRRRTASRHLTHGTHRFRVHHDRRGRRRPPGRP